MAIQRTADQFFCEIVPSNEELAIEVSAMLRVYRRHPDASTTVESEKPFSVPIDRANPKGREVAEATLMAQVQTARRAALDGSTIEITVGK